VLPNDKAGIWTFSVIGGTMRKLVDEAWSATASPDGSKIAFKRGSDIWLVGSNGEDPQKLLSPENSTGLEYCQWTPDGRGITYLQWREGSDEPGLMRRDLSSGATTTVLSERRLTNYRWTSDGRLICQLREQPPNEASTNLWEIRTDPRTGHATGKLRRITNWAGYGLFNFTVSADGKRLVLVDERFKSDVYVGELGANRTKLRNVRKLTTDDRLDWPGAWTPDSKAILFYSNRSGSFDIFKQNLDSKSVEHLTEGPGEERAPQVSPDRAWILAMQWPKTPAGKTPGSGQLVRIPLGGGSPQLALDLKGYPGAAEGVDRGVSRGYPDFRCPSAPGASCILAEAEKDQITFSIFDPVSGKKGRDSKAESRSESGAFWTSWDLSPDGSRIALVDDNGSGCDIRILQLGGGEEQVVSVKDRVHCNAVAWSADGRSLFVLNNLISRGGWLFHVAMDGTTHVLRETTKWFERPIASPDGRYLAYGELIAEGQVSMIENF
jgi:eukaryotic-like serine/threonine-protein kinase